MIKKILVTISIVIAFFAFSILMPFACSSCVASAQEYENTGNVGLMSKPSKDGYDYTNILSVAPLRISKNNGITVSSYENLILGFMGNSLDDNGNIIIDDNYIDVYTCVVDNENSTSTKSTLFLQRRCITRSQSLGNYYYTASDSLLADWNIALRANAGSYTYSNYDNLKVTYFSLQVGTNSLSKFNELEQVKMYLMKDDNLQTNVIEFYTASGSFAKLYVRFDLGYNATGFNANETWVDCTYTLDINSILSKYFYQTYQDGYNFGVEVGYRNGYSDGRSDGYDEGYLQGVTDTQEGVMPVFQSIVQGFSRFMTIEILPDFRLGSLIYIILGISLFTFLIHLFMK